VAAAALWAAIRRVFVLWRFWACAPLSLVFQLRRPVIRAWLRCGGLYCARSLVLFSSFTPPVCVGVFWTWFSVMISGPSWIWGRSLGRRVFFLRVSLFFRWLPPWPSGGLFALSLHFAAICAVSSPAPAGLPLISCLAWRRDFTAFPSMGASACPSFLGRLLWRPGPLRPLLPRCCGTFSVPFMTLTYLRLMGLARFVPFRLFCAPDFSRFLMWCAPVPVPLLSRLIWTLNFDAARRLSSPCALVAQTYRYPLDCALFLARRACAFSSIPWLGTAFACSASDCFPGNYWNSGF